jgi:hypothetical protein
MLGMIFLLIKRTIERERMIKKLVMNNGFNFENVEDFLTFFGCKTESGKIWTSKPKNITLKPYSGEINLENTNISLFSRGDRRIVEYIFSVPFKNNKIFFFDYEYSVSVGTRTTSVYCVNVALFKSNNDIPSFYLKPESFFDQIPNLFGYNDIDFPHRPIFSKKYYLKSDDETKVRYFFNDTLLAFLESTPNLYIESKNNLIAIYHNIFSREDEYLNFIENVKNILNFLRA